MCDLLNIASLCFVRCLSLFDACCCVSFSVVCCFLAVVCLVVCRLLRVDCWLLWMRGVLFAVCWLLLCVGDLCVAGVRGSSLVAVC